MNKNCFPGDEQICHFQFYFMCFYFEISIAEQSFAPFVTRLAGGMTGTKRGSEY